MTTKLIRAANSPLYAGVTPVDSCPAAIVRLGADTTHAASQGKRSEGW
ncbi:MAG: HDOD domain-containing protein [Candidatus Thiodiazotropha sp.]